MLIAAGSKEHVRRRLPQRPGRYTAPAPGLVKLLTVEENRQILQERLPGSRHRHLHAPGPAHGRAGKSSSV
ncbi:MAG: hypothetical protein ACLTW9_22465 [Enterocloster sp.]